jgi:nucleoside-diphosphate-sugar epimerase
VKADSVTNGGEASRYVPDVGLAKRELGLDVRVSLDKAIEKTAKWYAGNHYENI